MGTVHHQHAEIVQQANRITKRKTLYAAGAGLIPIPIVDTATLLAVQLTMIQSIAKLYGIEFKRHIAKSLIGSLIGSISSVGLIKIIPGLGTVLGGATASVAGAAATYALGKVFTHHFDQGGTLLDFDPIASREFFHKEFENGKRFIEQQNIPKTNGHSNGKTDLKEQLSRENELFYSQLEGLKAELNSLQNEQNFKQKPITAIRGIGSKIAIVLSKSGINNLESLSKTSTKELEKILTKAGISLNLVNVGKWVSDAQSIITGKVDSD